MKNIINLIIIAFLLTLLSCSKNEDGDNNKAQGTIKFEATTTNGGMNILNYMIKDGSIELFNEGPIETSQSQWSISHPASSRNQVSIIGLPDLGETLTIKVFFNGVLIGSASSPLSGGNAFVSVIIP